MTSIGKYLRILRGKRTLDEISKLAKVHIRYLEDIESGINQVTGTPVKPAAETLRRLSEVYNVTYEKLCDVAGIEFLEGYPPELDNGSSLFERAKELASDVQLRQIHLTNPGVELEDIIKALEIVKNSKK